MALLYSPERSRTKFFNHDFSLGILALDAVSNLYTREAAATRADKVRIDDRPKVEVHPSDAGRAVVIVDIGLLQDAEKVKNRVGPVFERIGPVYVMKHSHEVQANRDAELEILAAEEGRDVVTISNSKGGMDRVRMMSDPEFIKEHGFTSFSSYDSVPFLRRHIRLGGKVMGIGGLLLPDSHLLASRYSDHMVDEEKEVGEQFVRGTTTESYYEARRDIKSLLFSSSPADVAIRAAFSNDNIGRIITVSSANDRMVDTKKSNKWLQAVTGRHIPHIFDPLRPAQDHAGFTDTPELQLREVEKHLAGDYEPIPVQ